MLSPRPPGREPAFNLPTGLVVAIGCLCAVHAVRGLISDEADLDLLLELAFVPLRASLAAGWVEGSDALAAAGSDPSGARAALAAFFVAENAGKPWTVVSYAFLHGSWLHVGLNCVWLAAFGAPVVWRLGLGGAAVLAVGATIAGAAAQWAVDPASAGIVIGASAAVSGFMGAAAFFAFTPHPPPRGEAGLAQLLQDRRSLGFLGVWFAVNLALGVLGGPLGLVEGAVAWQAHIGGLLAGLALFPVLDRRGRQA